MTDERAIQPTEMSPIPITVDAINVGMLLRMPAMTAGLSVDFRELLATVLLEAADDVAQGHSATSVLGHMANTVANTMRQAGRERQ